MGCHSGKISPPAASKQPAATNTLLAPLTEPPVKDAIKEVEPAETPAEVAETPAEVAEPLGIFNGAWSHGVINGNALTWNDGSNSQIRIDEMTRAIEVTYDGLSYTGELRADDQIHWSDGDIWSRQLVAVAAEDLPEAASALKADDAETSHQESGHHLATIAESPLEKPTEQLQAPQEAPAAATIAPSAAERIAPESAGSKTYAGPPQQAAAHVKSTRPDEQCHDNQKTQRKERGMCCC